jgi:hypothetical protein
MDSYTGAPLDFELCTINEAIASESPTPLRTSFAVPLTTGTSTGLFSSPSSLASGSTGGGKVGSTLGLLYVDIVKNVCGGVIQNTEQLRFCCKSSSSCTVKAHKSKVNLTAGTLYVKHSRTGQARLRPCLSVELLSDEITLVDMMGRDLSLEVWTAHFDSLKAEAAGALKRSSLSSYGTTSPWEEVEIPSLDSLQAASDSFKTPKKLRLGPVLAPDTLPVMNAPRGSYYSQVAPLDIDDEDDVERSKIQRALQTIMSEWNQLNASFELIHLEFEKAGLTETRYRNTIAETLGDLQEAIRGTDNKMQLLGAGLGETITDSDEGPMSVWEAIRQLRSKNKTGKGVADGHNLYLEQLKNQLPNWGITLDNLAKSYQTNLPKIGTNLSALGSRILSLESKSQAPQGNTNSFLSFGNALGGMSAEKDSVTQTEFDQAKQEIQDAFTEVKKAIELLQAGGGPAMSVNASTTSSPVDLQEKVNKALKRLGEIEGRATGESFSLHGLTFCSRSEVADWLEKHQVPSCGFFWDLFSVMVSMKPKRHTGKDRSDENYSAKRTNSTTLENDLGAAMTHMRPEALYAKRGHGDLERLEAGFAACTSYSVWITGTECYKDQLTGMLNKFIEGVLGTVPPNAAYQFLATTLMSSVRTQWHNMCTFIDSFYVELTGEAGFNKDKAWKLVGRCVAALFAALEPYRSPVTMIVDMGTLDNKAAVLWAVLQCHRVGAAFDLVKYRGHPAVVKEMSLFMLTERVDPSEIEACSKRAEKAEKVAWEAQCEVAKLKDTVASLNREFKNAQIDLKALKAKK